MKRREMVYMCLNDAAQGEYHTLMGLIDYLIVDCNITPDRLCKIAERQFGIPIATSTATLALLHPNLVQ